MLNTRIDRNPLLILLPFALSACGGGNQYQGMDADALFRLAQIEVEEGDHDNAIEALDRLLISFGDWDRTPDARLMLADEYFARGDFLTSRSEYSRFLDRYPGHASSPDAALGTCRALAALAPKPQRDQTYTQEAIITCSNVVIDYSGLPQAGEAATVATELRLVMAEKEFQIADHYFRRGAYFSAIKYFEFVASLYPETEWAPRALLGIYRSNVELEYDDLAEEARQRLLERYPDSPAAVEIRTDGPSS